MTDYTPTLDTPFPAKSKPLIPPRMAIAILVVMLIGLAEPMYYKIGYALREDLGFLQVLVMGWQEVAFGFLFAVTVVLIHESWRVFMLKRWPYGTNDRLRQVFIFGGSAIYGAVAASGFVYVYYTVINDYDFSTTAVLSRTFTAILIPLIISGISESFGFHSAYVRERIAREAEGHAAANARYDALKNRLAPHFLFNSLGALAQTASERPEAVEGFVSALSDIYRYVLQTEGRDRSNLSDEWASAKALLLVQGERRPDTLNITIEIPEALNNRQLVPLSLLTLVENTFKHNVATRSEPLEVVISANEEGITVTNTIRPVLSVESSGIGLDNLEQRFQMAGAKPMQIIKNDTHFSVQLPWLPER